jgi:serine/threonine protein kinase
MTEAFSQERLREMAAHWLPTSRDSRPIRVHRNTSDFFSVDYGDIVEVGGSPYLVRNNAKEGRFGLDDEVKHWVKLAIDLRDGSRKVIKLVFHEKFKAHIAGIEFDCFRSPKKEARILDLVANEKNFMHGYAVKDEKDNIVRVLDFIYGPPLSKYIKNLEMDHETYFHDRFPDVLKQFMDCIRGIQFLHDHGEKHGDIRRDHILIDRESGHYRWIDFDFNYWHRENIYGYDLFGLGNVLIYLVGMGDVLLQDLTQKGHAVLDVLKDGDLNIVFSHRVVNLKKVHPYIPDALNEILLHFSKGANRFYETTGQLLDDLEAYRSER